MKHYLEALVNYALKKGLIEPGDEGFAFNRLLEVMGLDAAEDGAGVRCRRRCRRSWRR